MVSVCVRVSAGCVDCGGGAGRSLHLDTSGRRASTNGKAVSLGHSVKRHTVLIDTQRHTDAVTTVACVHEHLLSNWSVSLCCTDTVKTPCQHRGNTHSAPPERSARAHAMLEPLVLIHTMLHWKTRKHQTPCLGAVRDCKCKVGHTNRNGMRPGTRHTKRTRVASCAVCRGASRALSAGLDVAETLQSCCREQRGLVTR